MVCVELNVIFLEHLHRCSKGGVIKKRLLCMGDPLWMIINSNKIYLGNFVLT